jgi:hypothetical protein
MVQRGSARPASQVVMHACVLFRLAYVCLNVCLRARPPVWGSATLMSRCMWLVRCMYSSA